MMKLDEVKVEERVLMTSSARSRTNWGLTGKLVEFVKWTEWKELNRDDVERKAVALVRVM
jgi:hypothetical protein